MPAGLALLPNLCSDERHAPPNPLWTFMKGLYDGTNIGLHLLEEDKRSMIVNMENMFLVLPETDTVHNDGGETSKAYPPASN